MFSKTEFEEALSFLKQIKKIETCLDVAGPHTPRVIPYLAKMQYNEIQIDEDDLWFKEPDKLPTDEPPQADPETEEPKTQNTEQTQALSLTESLRKNFGHDTFRPGQREVINTLMHGKDACVFWATGNGKSICFQFIALHLEKIVVVVSPLLSLIADQIKNVNRKFGREIATSFAASTITPDAYQKIQTGECLLLYVTPESMENDKFLRELKQIHDSVRNIALIAVDEAHFVSQQGFEFRPSFRNIKNFRTHFTQTPMAAFTATAPEHIKNDIINTLELRSPAMFKSSYDKPNLKIEIFKRAKAIAFDEIVRECNKATEGSTIVFTYTRKDAESLHEQITRRARTNNTRSARLYHGQMPPDLRRAIERQFNDGTVRVVIATAASFGVGVDKPDVRQVFLYSMPKTFEDFTQAIGRAGRDGKPARVVAWFGNGDHVVHLKCKGKANDKTHLAMQKREKSSLFALKALFNDLTTCRRVAILKYWKEPHSPTWRCGECDNCTRGILQR